MLTAYLPLESVYQFHEVAENWIYRRYSGQVTESPGAERTRGAFVERVVAIFPDRSDKSTQQLLQGQTAPQTCTVYLRTRLLGTDNSVPQPADVLYNPRGEAFQVLSTGDWDEAKGYAVVLSRAGFRGRPPF